MRPGAPLSPRQAETLAGIMRGLNNKEIAVAMNCSPSSVKVHVKAVLSKLGAKTRTEAAIMTMRAAIRLPCPNCGYIDKGEGK
jgi:two-component system, NarL family, nitrate/nitrite response regulator NarL